MVDKTHNMKLAATKTPYELRFDLLAMARDTLETEYHSKMEEVRWAQEVGNRTVVSEMPRYPTREDIFQLAEQLKEFIEKK